MRTLGLILLAATCLGLSLITCTGCGKSGEESPDAKEKQNEGYMGTLAKSYRKGREEPNLLAVRNELKQFQAIKERWPKNLKEFVEWRGAELPQLPEGRKFDYDPKTGKLKIVDAKATEESK
jgi:hypothetical protein